MYLPPPLDYEPHESKDFGQFTPYNYTRNIVGSQDFSRRSISDILAVPHCGMFSFPELNAGSTCHSHRLTRSEHTFSVKRQLSIFSALQILGSLSQPLNFAVLA